MAFMATQDAMFSVGATEAGEHCMSKYERNIFGVSVIPFPEGANVIVQPYRGV